MAGACLLDGLAQILRTGDGLVIDLGNHISVPKSGLLGGSIGYYLDNEDALLRGNTLSITHLGGQRFRLHAQEGGWSAAAIVATVFASPFLLSGSVLAISKASRTGSLAQSYRELLGLAVAKHFHIHFFAGLVLRE